MSYSVLYVIRDGTEKVNTDLFFYFTLLFSVQARASNLSDSKFKKDRKGSFFLLHDYSSNTLPQGLNTLKIY